MVFKEKITLNGLRECGDCTEWYPPEMFAVRGHSKKGKPYHNSYCNKCMSVRARKYQKEHPAEFVSYQVRYKIDAMRRFFAPDRWTEVRELLLRDVVAALSPGGASYEAPGLPEVKA